MKTLKVEAVYPLAFETAEDVAEQIPGFIEKYNSRRLHSALGYLSSVQYEEQHTRTQSKTSHERVYPEGPTPARGHFWVEINKL